MRDETSKITNMVIDKKALDELVLNIEKGQWHSLKCLESGTILLEAKDGAYRPLDEDEIWNPENI